jgi:hypothetical protein
MKSMFIYIYIYIYIYICNTSAGMILAFTRCTDLALLTFNALIKSGSK